MRPEPRLGSGSMVGHSRGPASGVSRPAKPDYSLALPEGLVTVEAG
jgi:hypothetical protein